MAQLLYLNQYFTTTLSVVGGIDASQTTGIVVQSVTGLDTTKPGIALLSYADPLNETTAEWIEYTAVNSTTKTFTGVTRGVEKGSAKTHSNGVTVAFPVSESHINRIAEKLNASDTLGSGLDLASSQNIKVAGANPKRGIYIPAAALFGATTNGAASGQIETTTNKVNAKVLDFDASTEEYACINLPSPDYWDLGTVTTQFHWTAASGSGDVIWGAQGLARSNDDALDTAYGTAQEVTDTLITANDEHITSATSSITIGGTPAKGDQLYLRIYRKAADAGDTLAVDARLLGISVKFGVTTFSDE